MKPKKNVYKREVEKRGATAKYDFSRLLLFKPTTFEDTTPRKLLTAAKGYADRYGKDWKFQCWTSPKDSTAACIKRIK